MNRVRGVFDVLEEALLEVYTKFKLNFYKKIFSRFETREASLSAVETFCVDVIGALNEPTINEFAKFVHTSQANATYKVQSLIEKGHVIKQQSKEDKREYRLCMTERFHQYNHLSQDYIVEVSRRLQSRVCKEELKTFEKILRLISTELMPEIGQ